MYLLRIAYIFIACSLSILSCRAADADQNKLDSELFKSIQNPCWGEYEKTKSLLDAKANPNGVNTFKETPLWCATHRTGSATHPTMVKILLDAGAKPNAIIHMTEDHFSTPFHEAAKQFQLEYLDISYIQNFINADANPTIQNSSKVSVLDTAVAAPTIIPILLASKYMTDDAVKKAITFSEELRKNAKQVTLPKGDNLTSNNRVTIDNHKNHINKINESHGILTAFLTDKSKKSSTDASTTDTIKDKSESKKN